MRYVKFGGTFFIVMIMVFFMSCSDDEKTTEPENGFTPAGMVLIQAANTSFEMGSSVGFSDEQPIHTVAFTANFWMDTTEVTQADYDSVMSQAYSGYETPEWHDPYGIGTGYPAYSVTWGDAALYCNARSLRDNLDTVYTYSSIIGTPGNLCELENVETNFTANGYRLPTEAEWEFACRGGENADFFWGQDFDPYPATAADTAEINDYAIWYANAWQYGSEDPDFGTHQVASVLPNSFGLYDMAGNVYEFCNDWYGEYSADSLTDPTGPASGDWHFLRGGSWGTNAIFLRSANRTFFVPDYQYYFVGFRVVLREQ